VLTRFRGEDNNGGSVRGHICAFTLIIIIFAI
jgi:hypothetical protein